jgi:hypothetical protein
VCNAAAGVDVDVASSVLSHAIRQVLANCLDSTAPGLPNALRHLAANARRKAEHDATKMVSGHGPLVAASRAAGHGPSSGHDTSGDHRTASHGPVAVPGSSPSHRPDTVHGNSSEHGPDASHGNSSEHGGPNH